MTCGCDGTGWIIFLSDFTGRAGRTINHTSQARRCPGFIDYFRSSPLMHDLPAKANVLSGPDVCPDAVKLHRLLITKNARKKKGGREL